MVSEMIEFMSTQMDLKSNNYYKFSEVIIK